MVYLLAFTVSSCLIVHTLLYHGKTIINGIKRIRIEEDDVHARLMRHYPEVPNGWYYTLTATFFIVSIVSVEVWPTGMPVWTLCLSLLLPAIYLLPCGFIYAVTGQSLAINLLAEIIPGTILAGKPLPNMVRTSLPKLPEPSAHKFRRSSRHFPFKLLILP
jgi:OPT oligopeptide transporter protein